ncbi:MAG: tetratricopeptide repeat protein [Candidatus Tectomicrobia bacterium]|nr:tetratricopeptide repeat protein [Candidatus Tectomicrobia bacterium]
MVNSLSEILLSQLSEFINAHMGLYFPRGRWRDLERGIGSAAQEFGFKDIESCIPWLMSPPLTKNQIEILARHLTVGETYFFREKKSFEVLEEHIIPELIQARRGTDQHLKIWSAGCCTGEEPYSIAMLLDRLIPDIKNWRITILATDINVHFLGKALEGVYGEWSFRDTPQSIKEKYFRRKKDGRFEILPNIKKMVNFMYLNLVEDTYPALLNNTVALDMIFCRNVLIYFDPERTKKVIQKLGHSLVDGGWLIVSPSETPQVLHSQLVTVNFPGAILYRKDGHEPQTAENVVLISTTSSHPLYDEMQTSFQPSFYSVVEGEREVVPSQSTRRGDIEEQKRAKPRRTPYEEALALYEQGLYVEAAEKIVGLSLQDDSKAIALLARSYANQGKLTEALEWCEKAIAADKLNSAYHYLRATILGEQDQAEEAVTSLKRALYLDQNFVLAHFALANLLVKQGKPGESQKYFENALSLLSTYRQEETLPESEGVTAGRLLEIIASMIHGKR